MLPYKSNPNIIKLIRNREHPVIQANVDKYYFHFSPSAIDISSDFEALKLPKTLGISTEFHKFIKSEVEKYLGDKSDYDPLAICFGVRVRIEELLYYYANRRG